MTSGTDPKLLNRGLMRPHDDVGGAVVAVLKVDPFDQLACVLGGSDIPRVVQSGIGELVGSLHVDVIVEPVAERTFVLSAPTKGRYVADELARRIGAGYQQVTFEGIACFVDIRVGVALSRDFGGETNRDELQRFAHMALAHALTQGRRMVFADADLVAGAQELFARSRVLSAATPQDFYLHYQPVVDLSDFRVVGHEALMRWRDRDGITLSPTHFFPIIEETALLAPVTRSGIRTAIGDLAAGALPVERTDSFVAINLSELQLIDPATVDVIVESIGRAGIEPSRIWVEVREDRVIELDSEAAHAIESLSEFGCTICIDDLGAGYSALSYLFDLPVDIVKVDVTLVTKLATDRTAVAVARAIRDLAHASGARTVAEGVEEAGLIEILRDLGFDYAQGYHLGRPGPFGRA
ncbi:MAG: EAL domain-containing protein [Gordonia sp. (in: high G+C Gram-positive bacteria)]